MRISEIFESIQGEGLYVGMPALFIRVAGCNLLNLACGPCKMCDTKYALSSIQGSDSLDLNQLLREKLYSLLVITGGEPLLFQNDLLELLEQVAEELIPKINIETNGTIEPDIRWGNYATLFSVSPKVHTRDYLKLDEFKGRKTLLKVVYDKTLTDNEFYKFILKCASQMGITSLESIFVMPESTSLQTFLDHSNDCLKFCLKYNLRFGPREHLILFDGARGK